MKTSYNILALYDNRKTLKAIDCANKILSCISDKSFRDFTIENCALPASDVAQSAQIIEKASRAHAVMYCISDDEFQSQSFLQSLRKSLGLYAESRRYRSHPALLKNCVLKDEFIKNGFDFTIVRDVLGGMYFGEKGYSNNPTFGREAFDVEKYSELEIERVARIAYELACTRRRKLTPADKADCLTTSKLWRKIVTDINEDYPFVSVTPASVNDTATKLLSDPSAFDVILSSNVFGDFLNGISSVFLETGCVTQSSCGETTLGMYGTNVGVCSLLPFDDSVNPIGIILACAEMLRNSFDMADLANNIENAVDSALSEGFIPKQFGGNMREEEFISEIIKRL